MEAIAYLKTEASKDAEPLPDVELFFISAALNADGGNAFRRMFSLSHEVYDKVWKPLSKGNVSQVSDFFLINIVINKVCGL